MKTKWTKAFLLFFFLIFSLTLSECKKEKEIADSYVFDISQETDWDYWMVAKDGSNLSIKVIDSKPSIVYFKPVKNDDGYPIFLDENGVPSRMEFEDHIILFGNFREKVMDMSIIKPDGSIKVFRDVPVEFDFTSLQQKGVYGQGADIIRWAGHIVSAAACGLGWAAAVPSGGLSLTVAYIGCGAMVVGIATEFLPDNFEILGLSSTSISTATTIIGCADDLGLSCLLDLISLELEISGAVVEDMENQINKISDALYELDGKVFDLDKNVYNTVIIGTQTWMAENLKTTKYRDGTPIPNVTDMWAWTALNTGAYCDYDNEPTFSTTYGKLYNCYTVADPRSLCPMGWHVPSKDEWLTLAYYLGGQMVAGGKLKSTTLWNSPNTGTNETGFAALPGGYRRLVYSGVGDHGYWWSSTGYSSGDFYSIVMQGGINDLILQFGDHDYYGLSVRCVRD